MRPIFSIFHYLLAGLLFSCKPSLLLAETPPIEADSSFVIESEYHTGNDVIRELVSTDEMLFHNITQCKSGLNNSIVRMHALSELARKKGKYVILGCVENKPQDKQPNKFLHSIQLHLYRDAAFIPQQYWFLQTPYVALQEIVIGREYEHEKVDIAMIKQEPFDGILYSSLTGSELDCPSAIRHEHILQMKIQRLIYNEGVHQLDLNCFSVNEKGYVSQLASHTIDVIAERKKILGDEDEYLDEDWEEYEEDKSSDN